MKPADFDYVRRYVQEHAAIVIEDSKEYLVESRLQTLARKTNYASIEGLCEDLRADPGHGLHRQLLDAMTTNETSFFRDVHPFEALRKSILPELLGRRAGERQLNFWCGAASTGQEPFSVLMTLAEHFPELLLWQLNFVATDLCQEVLQKARAGRFSQLEVNRGLPASLLVKYFKQSSGAWEFSETLRKRVDFQEMNLVKEWLPMPPCDLVFLRNVLIYFDLDTKRMILGKIRRLLRPGGFLFLGEAETTFNLDENFEQLVFEKSVCYRVR